MIWIGFKNIRCSYIPMRNFSDRLLDLIDELENPSCGGLDPVIDNIPQHILQQAMKESDAKPHENGESAWRATGRALEIFNQRIIDATLDVFPAYKLQSAYYEKYREYGIRAFDDTIRYVRSMGRVAITDGKRNDIDRTARAYADAHLGFVTLATGVNVPAFDSDALTVNPYLGSDGLRPFIEVCKEFSKGIFVLDKTSNPSSLELQDLELAEKHGGRKLYEQIALKMEILGRDLIGERGYSSLGLVVGASGATPEDVKRMAARIRELNPYAIILVPGYGQQGGTGKDVVPNFNREGYGAIVNNSSALIFAYMREPYKSLYGPEEFDQAARASALAMKDDITSALKNAEFKRWL